MADASASMPERTLGPGYRIERFEDSAVSANDVLSFWGRERAVPADEARQRVHEVHLVGTHDDHGLVAVSTAYLQRNAQLAMDFWHYRAFTAAAHRSSNVAAMLATAGTDQLAAAFVSGEDVRGSGVIFEIENPGLKRALPQAVWDRARTVTFVGQNARGDHVYVRYFPGATVPVPTPANAED